jgi:hypothetical protein
MLAVLPFGLLTELLSTDVEASGAADTVPSLVELAAPSIVGGSIFFRPGELILGRPDLAGRPGFLPLAGGRKISLPEDLSNYENLGGGCMDLPPSDRGSSTATPTVLARGDLGADGTIETVLVVRADPLSPPIVRVLRGNIVIGQSALPMPARPCRGIIAEADADDEPELLVVWTSTGAQGVTYGVNVLRLPESSP